MVFVVLQELEYCKNVLLSVRDDIGIRTVIREWTPLDNAVADIFAIAMCVVLIMLGMRAVAAVVFS